MGIVADANSNYKFVVKNSWVTTLNIIEGYFYISPYDFHKMVKIIQIPVLTP
jgi:hypothetical protein